VAAHQLWIGASDAARDARPSQADELGAAERRTAALDWIFSGGR
jgi:hypothetical protein